MRASPPPNFKMAESAPKSDNYNKIVCRSRQAVNVKSGILYDSLIKCLEQNSERNEQSRSQYCQKFKEIYEKVMQENIVVNGETSEITAANTTPDFEAVDKQMQACIGEELLPQLDDLVVKVVKQRKKLPRACSNIVSDFANHQALYMSKVKPCAPKVDLGPVISEAKGVTHFIDRQQLQSMCSTVTHLTKMTHKDQDRAIHLSRAVEIESANKNCQMATVFAHLSPLNGDNDQQHVSVPCLCKTKRKLGMSVLDHTGTTSSKTARTSFMLVTDFAVEPLEL